MKNIKLNSLTAETVSRNEMNHVRGGGARCGCGCHYANSGGSSMEVNMCYNSSTGFVSEGGSIISIDAGAEYKWVNGIFTFTATNVKSGVFNN